MAVRVRIRVRGRNVKLLLSMFLRAVGHAVELIASRAYRFYWLPRFPRGPIHKAPAGVSEETVMNPAMPKTI